MGVPLRVVLFVSSPRTCGLFSSITHAFNFEFFFFNLLQHPKKTLKKSAKFSFVGQSARVIQALLRRALALLPSSLLLYCFLFFRFFFWVCCLFARGLSLLPGGWFRGLFGSFFCLLWWLLLLLFLFLRALRACWLVLVLSGFAVLVPLFPLLRFGLRWLLPFLRGFPFLAVALVVCVVWLGLLFLLLRFSLLPLSASVVVRSLLVLLRWFARLLRVALRFGFRFLRLRAPLGLFLPPFLLVVSVGLVRALGLRSLSLAVWAFLLCSFSLLGCFLLLAGAFFRWAVVSFSVRSFVIN